MKIDLFQSCGPCCVFQICWHIECSTFTASSFRIWNSSTGIPSPPLALFVVMLPKAHLTAHQSQMKNMETEFGGNRKVALILSWWRGARSKLMPQELGPHLHKESRDLCTMRAHSQELAMSNQGVRILISFSCIVSKTAQAGISNPVTEAGRLVVLWPPFSYVTTRGRVL